jgi:cob(I)alamin adenosyltransferase
MAVRITRVYTRTGDRGETGLVGGKRVPKDSPRLEAYGTIDELNSVLGVAGALNEERLAEGEAHAFLDRVLKEIQQQLFDLGAELATPPEASGRGGPRIGESEVKRIEELIDGCQKELGPLESFVLPGGGKIGAQLHHARTVCRRAEREIVRLSRSEPVGEGAIKYVNRLSDLLFVLARWIGAKTGAREVLWRPGPQRKG